MVMVVVGSDTYGRVKKVGATPIVTKFAMLSFLPIYPQQSFYWIGSGETESTGIPFLFSEQSTALYGLPLSNLDRWSVTMAYLRGLFGMLAVFGFFVTIPGIMYLTGERLDKVAISMTQLLGVFFLVGVGGGLLTYLLPDTPERESKIRECCAELLGIAADPARVPPEYNQALIEEIDRVFAIASDRRWQLVRQLIAVRARLAETDDEALEQATDQLLHAL